MEIRYKNEVLGLGELPPGGTADQFLAKASNGDYDTHWVDSPEGSGDSVFLVKAPVGTIVIWSGTVDNIPAGWELCDGQGGRPDLLDKFVLGAGTKHVVGSSGGSEEVTLTLAQMPIHRHGLAIGPSNTTPYISAVGTNKNSIGSDFSTANAGGDQPHPNMPPYYALCYIIKVTPDETDKEKMQILNVPIGGIINWSGTEADVPDGWHVCNGEDGTIDLRDKFVLGAGTKHIIGATGGSEEVTLTAEQMPSHRHTIDVATGAGNVGGKLVAQNATGQFTSNTNYSGGYFDGTSVATRPHSNMPPYYTLLYIQKISDSPTDYATKAYVDESKKEVYSTEETEIGTWINGKPIYQKSFFAESFSVSPGTFGNLFGPIENVDSVISISLSFEYNNDVITSPFYGTDSLYCTHSFSKSTNYIQFAAGTTNFSMNGKKFCSTIRYTKITEPVVVTPQSDEVPQFVESPASGVE